MKIEAGKFYKLRNEKKAIVYEITNDEGYSIYGAVIRGEKRISMTWTKTGFYHREDVGHRYDIISPWVEAPVVQWDKLPPWIVAVSRDKSTDSKCIWCWSTPPTICFEEGECWKYAGEFPCWPHKTICIAEGVYEFNGDWKDSLAVRPGYEEE